jgi:starch phosphorylase
MRDRLIEFANDSQQAIRDHGSKMVYYMSIEYLLGRSLHNAVTNLGLENQYTTALKELGFVLEDLYEKEQDAALGNGGLGRLAACFLDSLATMNYPAWGYGLRCAGALKSWG